MKNVTCKNNYFCVDKINECIIYSLERIPNNEIFKNFDKEKGQHH